MQLAKSPPSLLIVWECSSNKHYCFLGNCVTETVNHFCMQPAGHHFRILPRQAEWWEWCCMELRMLSSCHYVWMNTLTVLDCIIHIFCSFCNQRPRRLKDYTWGLKPNRTTYFPVTFASICSSYVSRCIHLYMKWILWSVLHLIFCQLLFLAPSCSSQYAVVFCM